MNRKAEGLSHTPVACMNWVIVRSKYLVLKSAWFKAWRVLLERLIMVRRLGLYNTQPPLDALHACNVTNAVKRIESVSLFRG